VCVSGPLPGAVHDLTAARIWGITGKLAACGLVVLGDKGYLGEDGIRTPYRGRNKPAAQKDANRAHARLLTRATAMPRPSWRRMSCSARRRETGCCTCPPREIVPR
jgi:DDE superfamily endonuclease